MQKEAKKGLRPRITNDRRDEVREEARVTTMNIVQEQGYEDEAPKDRFCEEKLWEETFPNEPKPDKPATEHFVSAKFMTGWWIAPTQPGLHERRHLHRNTVQEITNHENNKGPFGNERLERARQAQTNYFENVKEQTKKAAVKAPSPLSFSNPQEMLKHALKLKETGGGESEQKAENPKFVAEDPVADVDVSDGSSDDQDEPKSIGAIFNPGHAKAKAGKPGKAAMGPPKPLPKATPLTGPPPPKHTGLAAVSTRTGNPPDAIVAKGRSTRREKTKPAGDIDDEDIKMDGRPLRAKTNLRNLIDKAQDAITKADDFVSTEHEHDNKDERGIWKKEAKEQMSRMREYVTNLKKNK